MSNYKILTVTAHIGVTQTTSSPSQI